MADDLKIFGLDVDQNYARRIAAHLDIPLSKHVEEEFEDGETYTRSLVNVRNADVYVITSLASDTKQPVGLKYTKLLFFLGSLKDASAARITVVMPYMGYARQDRKTESRAPVTTRYVAQTLETLGCNRFITLDVHNLAAFQNSFRIPTDNLEAKNLFADYLCGITFEDGQRVTYQTDITDPLINDSRNIVVLSPDAGGMARCKRFRNALECRLNVENKITVAYLDKQRISGVEIDGDKIVGDVDNKRVIIIDDMISSGRTINHCKKAVQEAGGEIYAVCATHGLFVGQANEFLSEERLIITDTIPPFRLSDDFVEGQNLHIISTVRLLAQAIHRTHEHGSISELLTD